MNDLNQGASSFQRIVARLRNAATRAPSNFRNYVFSQFGYWPVSSMEGHWLATMPIYCISLRKATERRTLMAKQAKKMQLQSFHFVEAVESSSLTPESVITDGLYDDQESRKWHPNGLTLKEVACSLSHVECYKRIVEAGHARALILEDDALFRTGRLRRLDIDQVPRWVDMLFLNSFLLKTPPDNRIADGLYDDTSYNGSAAADLITQSAAKQLLAAAVPVVHAADGLLGRVLAQPADQPHQFRQRGTPLSLRGAIVYPEAVINGSIEHYQKTTLR
jgi:glycosyl transferase family 25